MSTSEEDRRTTAALERIAEALETIVRIVEAEILTEEAGDEWFRNHNS